MSLDALIMLAGAFVAALPFLGFPYSWDMVLFFLLGVLVIGLGIVVRRRGNTTPHRPSQKSRPAFSESAPLPENEGEMMGN